MGQLKSFKTYLAELWEQPYPTGSFKHKYLSSNGTKMHIVTFSSTLPNHKELMIGFGTFVSEVGSMEDSTWEIVFTVDGSTELTNDKTVNPLRIFSTVIEATRKFLEWHKKEYGDYPFGLKISAKKSDDKRDSVYQMLLNKLGPKYGFRHKRVLAFNRDPNYQTTIISRGTESYA